MSLAGITLANPGASNKMPIQLAYHIGALFWNQKCFSKGFRENIKHIKNMMETSSSEFPGFQICVHNDEYVYKRSLSRLQRRVPRPLQIKPPKGPVDQCKNGTNEMPTSASSISASSLNSFFNSKDPIPLLSPLVLPSLLDSAFIQEGNAAVPI